MPVIRYKRITGIVHVLLRKGFRLCDMLPSFAVQCAKECHEVSLLLVG